MENSPRFDLPAALENWRTELAAQPNLTAEVRRELETHLRDTLAGFQQRGLSDEEAFWLARRRVGQPAQLGEEFVKADPAAVWRERVFWMVATLLAYSLWNTVADDASRLITMVVTNWLSWHTHTDWVNPQRWHNVVVAGLFSSVIRLIPLGMAVVYLLQGRLNQNPRLTSFLRMRKNIVKVSAGIVALHSILPIAFLLQVYFFNPWNESARQIAALAVWSGLLSSVTWLLTLAGFTVWLMPSQHKITRQTA